MITTLTKEEFNAVKGAFCLLNSMVLSGEEHSKTSEKIVNEALNVLTFKDIFPRADDSEG